MITYSEALNVAKVYIDGNKINSRFELVILEDNVIEFEFGWLFHFQTKKFVETGDMLFMLGDNAPLIVDKLTGSLSVTGTAYNEDYYIKEYVKERTRDI